jgi:hypothetical protein
MSNYHTGSLEAALRQLAQSEFIAAAHQRLQRNIEAINAELAEAVRKEIPAFIESRNPHTLPDLAVHGPEHTAHMFHLLSGAPDIRFDFVQRHAKRRAQQRFPLETTLHAYRCGHRVLSRWLREATLAAIPPTDNASQAIADVADFMNEYTNAISTIFAASYVAHARLLANVEGDHRAELLNILLNGYDESDGRVASILGDAGYLDQRQSFCVVLAQPVDSAEMLSPARARRLADAIDQILRDFPARRTLDVRNNKVTVVLADVRRTSGWTAPRAALAKRVASELIRAGNAVLIGISNDVPSTSQIPTAHREASLALEVADVEHRVVQFSEIPMRHLLLHLAREEMQQILPAWSESFLVADAKARGTLTATLRAYANADMNVLQAAESLSVHPNTIYARFQKILDLTGADAKSYHVLTELLTIADCRQHGYVDWTLHSL